VDLPGETGGMLAHHSTWTSYSPVSVAIGQEMAVSPLQLAVGFSALANEGVVMCPHVVSRVLDSKGKVVKETEPRTLGRAVSAETARDKVVPMLAEVVKRGTGKRAKSKIYTLAGKTGTAQKPLENGGGYSHEKFVSTFACFGPVEDPRVCVVVMVNETAPRKPYYGGTVAAPAAGEILERTLQYLMVPRSSSLETAYATSRR
jgi:cell division protein FtsI/penicillin-binding protein 2